MKAELGDLSIAHEIDGTANAYVYLIHLDENMEHARHYIGYTTNLMRRLKQHSIGDHNSSKFMREVYRRRITWRVTKVWTFDLCQDAWNHEKRIKRSAKSAWYCPLCKDQQRKRSAESMRKTRERRKKNKLITQSE